MNSIKTDLTTAQDPSLQYDVSLRHINTDVNHLVKTSLEASSHLLNGDDKASEQRLEQLDHGLLCLLMAALNNHDNSFIYQLVVEVRNFKIFETS